MYLTNKPDLQLCFCNVIDSVADCFESVSINPEYVLLFLGLGFLATFARQGADDEHADAIGKLDSNKLKT